jgi:hypothetical protein
VVPTEIATTPLNTCEAVTASPPLPGCALRSQSLVRRWRRWTASFASASWRRMPGRLASRAPRTWASIGRSARTPCPRVGRTAVQHSTWPKYAKPCKAVNVTASIEAGGRLQPCIRASPSSMLSDVLVHLHAHFGWRGDSVIWCACVRWTSSCLRRNRSTACWQPTAKWPPLYDQVSPLPRPAAARGGLGEEGVGHARSSVCRARTVLLWLWLMCGRLCAESAVSELFAVSEQLVQPIDDFFSNVFVMAVRPPPACGTNGPPGCEPAAASQYTGRLQSCSSCSQPRNACDCGLVTNAIQL